MSKFRKLGAGLLGIGLLAGLILPQSASAQTLERIKKADTIKLGFIDRAAPYSYLGADGKPSGYAIEVCQVVVDAIKFKLAQPALKVSYVALKAEDAEETVSQGGVDLLCTATVETLKRRERMSYSIPVVSGGIGVLLRGDAAQSLRDVLSGKPARSGPVWRGTTNGGLSNHTYAVRGGTVTEAWVREQTRRLGVTVNAITVDDYGKGIELVRARQADAFFGERALLKDYVQRNKLSGEVLVLERRFAAEPLALAMGRNEDDLRLLVDGALSRLLKSPDFATLYERHFGPLDEASRLIYTGFALP
ncbi:amino acid ABC transporter substrate-binding protein [Paucibacter sp. B2R-40]|uniref:amino acid ABC transporter substrate-binding protein n=1 Tax=Paucibacter sp. B2R-40 TaxID=2893554 RepID=UPI0021E4628E|nr:amino acid ABC transporter substrate-binding protein [Paucibacter sp. B2R-40]MCV2356067.1 amino acid ABC transporter substrate-binding protein [Paucibacter sp. B2R-40]